MKLYKLFNYISRLTPLKFIIVACVLSIFINWLLQIKSGNSSWDVDGFMYLGFRLLEGEFLWTIEYDDKLPIVQILFVLPSLFESIFIWFLISSTFVIFGAWACYIFVIDVLSKYSSIPSVERQLSAILASISMIYLSTFLPGTFYHINLVSASAAIISFALLIRSLQNDNRINIILFFISAFSASLSIGIRPYFFFSLITGVPLLIINHFRILRKKSKIFKLVGFWILLVGLFGFILNVVPYIYIGDLNSLYAGISMLSQELNPQEIQYTILNFITGLWKQPLMIKIFIIFSVVTVIKILFKLITSNTENFIIRKIQYDIIILILISPLLLLALILSKHFHTHYLQMFAPFLALGVGFFFSIGFSSLVKKLSKGSKVVWLITISFVLITILPVSINDLIKFNKEKNIDHVTYVAEAVSMQPEDQQDFLFIDDIRSHWMLSESRHGFPQAANTRHIILLDWWTEIKMPIHFEHPTNSEEYCMALEKKGPSLVFIYQLKNFETSCLKTSSVYRFLKQLHNGVSLFKRY